MATLQDASGLPRDRYVNTFYVNTITPFSDVPASLATIHGFVHDFYESIKFALSPQLTGTTHTVKSYDMAVPEGTRVPISPLTFSLTPPTTGAFPAEVALVLTLEASPQPGVLPQSTRGRLYLGPLNVGMSGSVGPQGGASPNLTGIGTILSAADTMITAINGVGNAAVCIASQRQDKADLPIGSRQAYPVINVSIDNEWDTQRSRGSRASQRVRTAVSTPPGLPRSW